MNAGYCRWKSLLLTALLILLFTNISLALPDPPRKYKPKATGKTSYDASVLLDQVAALEKRVEELGRRVSDTADLKSEINDLKARLEIAEARVAAAEAVPSNLPGGLAGLSASPSGTVAGSNDPPVPDSQAGAPQQEPDTLPSLSKRTAALETAVKRIGPIRFSGDFRLRADMIFRPPYDHPKPGETALTHVQNVRGRYRLRLNLDAEVNEWISFHGQLVTGSVVTPNTTDQDFTSTVARHPFMISEAWADFHPANWFSAQGGRLQEVFADNSRFIFDDDIRFNGFNETFIRNFADPVLGFKSIEFRAGQYILSNPNVAIVNSTNLAPAGDTVGSTGRDSNLFDQGIQATQQLTERTTHQFTANFQVYRQPNHIQFASTAAGVSVIVQSGIGLTLSGPLPQTGNATLTPGGAIYTAPRFQIGRLAYQLNYAGFKVGNREYPVLFNLQVARNVGTGLPQRDGLLTYLRVGQVKGLGDQSFLYLFSIKGANAMISQLTDDNLGTTTGVNTRVHHIRWDIGLGKGVQLQSLLYIQNELANSGQYRNFFVPLNAYTPRQYRVQEQIVITF
jgi:hypothetical protein